MSVWIGLAAAVVVGIKLWAISGWREVQRQVRETEEKLSERDPGFSDGLLPDKSERHLIHSRSCG